MVKEIINSTFRQTNLQNESEEYLAKLPHGLDLEVPHQLPQKRATKNGARL